MTSAELVGEFIAVRDIPYSIPLRFTEEDRCCTGKHKKLLAVLRAHEYDVRWRVCSFQWSSVPLPESVTSQPHDDVSTHAYLEVRLNALWRVVDATWDSGIASRFAVNTWDGLSDTKIAVPCVRAYSTAESAAIIAHETQKEFEEDILVNGKFYAAFNRWLVTLREKSAPPAKRTKNRETPMRG